ncbi:MAG: cell division protein ZapA [Candidatus Pelagibacter sp. TMED273]|nr:MAG: cell division protein ZapA [Candidatus Pelagibacter sp. TMED273]|tara:strand:- start:6427 stop:6873 length:447 start_codon:yes stop_codon:yes gene_type:complete
MGNINIKFNGKEYLLSCEDGQEEHLESLSIELNKKFLRLKDELGNLGENKLLLITAIKIIDELSDIEKKTSIKKQEFEKLSSKFLELKSLVYNYRDEKEKEIKKLSNDSQQFKKEIEDNKKNYDQIIDNTTLEIENFLKKIDNENKVQ